jgi:hypothetical protein
MVTAKTQHSLKNAEEYFEEHLSVGDYYDQGQRVAGEWIGLMGIWALVFGGMMPVGGIESGFLSHAVGVPWTITVGALICAGAGLVTWWTVRRNPPPAADGGDQYHQLSPNQTDNRKSG